MTWTKLSARTACIDGCNAIYGIRFGLPDAEECYR
jgi:hypothetical protein